MDNGKEVITVYVLNRKRHTTVVGTIRNALGGGHEESIAGKEFRYHLGNNVNLEINVVPLGQINKKKNQGRQP